MDYVEFKRQLEATLALLNNPVPEHPMWNMLLSGQLDSLKKMLNNLEKVNGWRIVAMSSKQASEMKFQEVADRLGLSVMFVDDERDQEPFEDDGNLHVVENGVRAVFDVGEGQSLSSKKQNRNVLSVLQALSLPVNRGRVFN